MLDLGFMPDIEKILAALSDFPHQTMLFSATMPGAIVRLARTFMTQPVHIRADSESSAPTHASTRQVIFQAHRMDKLPVLSRILQVPDRGRTIVFTRTKRTAAQTAQELADLGFHVGAVHGDLHQQAREKALQGFRDGTVPILVATDDRKSTRLNSSHVAISYAVFCLKKKTDYRMDRLMRAQRGEGRGRAGEAPSTHPPVHALRRP